MRKKHRNRNSMIKAAILIAAALLLVIALLRLAGQKSSQMISREQAEQAVLQEYAGDVESLTLNSGKYVAELKTAQGRYKLELDGATGEIESIVLLESLPGQPTSQPSVEPSAGSGIVASPSPSPSPSPSAQRAVSEEEAIRLALQEVPGKADDVETEINESGAFYLVEVKGADGRDAVVQVDAISGSIRSVAWEDDEDEDH